jgi:hypothetical protein
VPARTRVQHSETEERRAFHVALAIELAIVAIGAAIYVIVRELTEGSPARAIDNARALYGIEQRLGIDQEFTLHSLVLRHVWLRDLVNWVYIWGHWPVIICVASWLYVHRRERYRWLRNGMFASGLIGFAFFFLVPMAPPRLSGLGYTDTITTWSSSYRVLQPPSYANLYAAMPSLHFGWDLLVGVALFLSTSILAVRILALLMPTLMGFSVIATANHWVLDVIVGLLVVTAGVALCEAGSQVKQRRRRARARSREPVRESA